MRIIIFLFLMVFVTSCGTPFVESPTPRTKQSLAIEVRNEAFDQLKAEKELYPCGIGSGMMHQIWMLALEFHYYKDVNINQARELLMSAGTVFLDIINNNEQIRPFLQNYPFKPENVEIGIYLQKPDGSKPDPEKMTVISLRDGVLKYKVDEPGTSKLLTIYQETFEEAAAKLNTVASR